MIPYSWRRATRILRAAVAAHNLRRKDPLAHRYLIVDLHSGHSIVEDSLYSLRSPGGYARVMRDLRVSQVTAGPE